MRLHLCGWTLWALTVAASLTRASWSTQELLSGLMVNNTSAKAAFGHPWTNYGPKRLSFCLCFFQENDLQDFLEEKNHLNLKLFSSGHKASEYAKVRPEHVGHQTPVEEEEDRPSRICCQTKKGTLKGLKLIIYKCSFKFVHLGNTKELDLEGVFPPQRSSTKDTTNTTMLRRDLSALSSVFLGAKV